MRGTSCGFRIANSARSSGAPSTPSLVGVSPRPARLIVRVNTPRRRAGSARRSHSVATASQCRQLGRLIRTRLSRAPGVGQTMISELRCRETLVRTWPAVGIHDESVATKSGAPALSFRRLFSAEMSRTTHRSPANISKRLRFKARRVTTTDSATSRLIAPRLGQHNNFVSLAIDIGDITQSTASELVNGVPPFRMRCSGASRGGAGRVNLVGLVPFRKDSRARTVLHGRATAQKPNRSFARQSEQVRAILPSCGSACAVVEPSIADVSDAIAARRLLLRRRRRPRRGWRIQRARRACACAAAGCRAA